MSPTSDSTPLIDGLLTKVADNDPVFVHMFFSLANLPSPRLLRWLLLLGRAIRRVALWMDILGEEAFQVVNAAFPVPRKSSHVLQELSLMQSLLSMRVNVTDSFGEFRIPEELRSLVLTETPPGGLES